MQERLELSVLSPASDPELGRPCFEIAPLR